MKYRHRKLKQREMHEVTVGERDTCYCGFDNHVTWYWPYCVTAFALTSRLWYVTSDESWWILHPDEIYQATEVAFSEAYGYGFLPYEYLPKPTHVVTPAENHSLRAGMFGLRSFLVPDVFAGVLFLESLVGWRSSPLLICKLFNVVVTSTLPLSVFSFVNKIFSCRLLAIVASALSAVELHLVVFGSHPIVNSFTSPFVFLSIAYLVPNEVRTEPKSKYSNENVSSHLLIDRSPENYENHSHVSSSTKKDVSGAVRRLSKDRNNNKDSKKNSLTPGYLNSRSAKSEHSCSEDEHTSYPEWMIKMLAGFVMGALCYIRVDTTVFSLIVLIITSLATTTNFVRTAVNAIYSCVGAVCSCALCAVYDHVRYGAYVISPLQWFQFNVVSGKAKTLFDSQLNTSYISEFYRDSLGVILCSVSVLYVITTCLNMRSQQSDITVNAYRRQELAVSASFLLVLLAYSVIGHREMRFIHNCFVLYGMIIAFVVHRFAAEYRTHPGVVKASIGLFYVILSMNTFVSFPWMQTEELQRWTYGIPKDSRDLNLCLDNVRRQNDVTGVVIDGDIYDIGGFSVLKHDVPLIVKTYHEYFVYNKRKKNVYEISSSVRILNFFDDVFHESNIQYLVESIASDTKFNYMISKQVAKPLAQFFTTFSKCGQFYVYKRTDSQPQPSPRGVKARAVNATLLEHEAQLLISRGLNAKAISRLDGVLDKCDGQLKVQVYQQLIASYYKLGQNSMVNKLQKECFTEFGRERCISSHQRASIHRDYERLK